MKILGWPALRYYGINPYTKLLYTSVESLGAEVESYSVLRAFTRRYDVLHVHWPEYYIAHRKSLKAFLGTLLVFGSVWWQRAMGAKVVWTVHNLGSHNQTRPGLEKYFWPVLTRSINGYFCLTEQGMERARQKWKSLQTLPGFVVPHGHYREQYPNTFSRQAARAKLQIRSGCRVVLFFGTVAPYKNIPTLIRVFRESFRQDNVVLLIAGISQESEARRVVEEAADDPRIRLHLGNVAEEEIQYFFNASDLVVLPFTEILNSGSAILALSFNRPILVPAQGAMPELQKMVGKDWVQTYPDDLHPEVLRNSLEWASTQRAQADLHELNWEAIARKTLDAYSFVISQRHHSTRLAEQKR